MVQRVETVSGCIASQPRSLSGKQRNRMKPIKSDGAIAQEIINFADRCDIRR